MHASQVAVVPRREARSSQPTLTAAERNVRPALRVHPHEAPEPPRDGATPTRPARWPIVTFQNIAAIQAVMQNEFGVPLWAPSPQAATTLVLGTHPEGVQPFRERANIDRGEYVPYGSIGQLSTDEKYNLLIGAR